MDPSVLKYYKRYRAKNYPAHSAMYLAKVRAAWDVAESNGLVRVRAEVEIDCYDDSYIDTWDVSDAKKERYRKEVYDRIDREGYWIYFTEYRLTDDEPWEVAESCGGFIGEDWIDSGCDIDMMVAALDALDKCYQAEADEIVSRATYASVV